MRVTSSPVVVYILYNVQQVRIILVYVSEHGLTGPTYPYSSWANVDRSVCHTASSIRFVVRRLFYIFRATAVPLGNMDAEGRDRWPL